MHGGPAVKYYWLMKLKLRATATTQALKLWHTLQEAELLIAVLLGSGGGEDRGAVALIDAPIKPGSCSCPSTRTSAIPLCKIFRGQQFAAFAIGEYLTTRCHWI